MLFFYHFCISELRGASDLNNEHATKLKFEGPGGNWAGQASFGSGY